jgi:Xaa-Pro dipeptidase
VKEQYLSRIDGLKQYLTEKNIDVAMVTNPKNIFYYTGFDSEPYERFLALVLDNKAGKVYLFVPALDMELATSHSCVSNIIPISDEQNPYEIVKQTIGSKFNTFGLEENQVSLYQSRQLRDWMNINHFQNVENFLLSQRMRKSEEEARKVKNAVEIIEKVLSDGIKRVKVGMTELDLTAEFEYLMRKTGAEGPAFSTTVLSGENSALPHGSPGTRTIQNGDFLLIDMGVIKDGYCSDISRTFVIGEATRKQRKIYETVSMATRQAVDAAKLGVQAGEVDKAARQVIKDNGYGKYFNNRVGHGLGIEVHEGPSVHGANEQKIEKGFLFTIEPGIYVPGYGGVRIEENVYIDFNGETRVLTSYPAELTCI